MLDLDPVVLARIQFAANITFHILFPSITIALGWILLFFKLRFSATNDSAWMDAYLFWTKIFALCFALGVVSGITMSFQFGTNWPGFMETVGNIAGPLLGYEVLTAFFLEATFLGIMLFGFSRVSRRAHTTATALVAFGTTLSAFWILVLNSWMQTPVGFEMIDGKAHATDWMEIIFNPSMPYRMVHMLLASGLTASFLIAGISAYRWLRHDRTRAVFLALKTGVYTAALLIPIQIIVGDLHGLNTLKHQPAKIAAIEGLWETRAAAPLVLFGQPNEQTRSNGRSIEIEGLASLLLTHDINGVVRGLNEFSGEHPPVAKVFWSFRIMVFIGIVMLTVSWWATYRLHRRGTITKTLARVLTGTTFAGWIGTVAGWYVSEIGRQPYLVYGLLRTEDAVSPVPASSIAFTLGLYLIVYSLLLVAFVSTVFFMARRAGKINAVDTMPHRPLVFSPAE
ncbi:MAG: cytochrome ubiquinol oxidase subunit I [Holosporales bacterium]|jgi:cytochrome d ubiquinol oxidase subunit I